MRLTRNLLAKIRMEAGYKTAETAAVKLGVSKPYLLSCESGRAAPSYGLIARMMSLYGCPEKRIRLAIRKTQRELLQRKLEVL